MALRITSLPMLSRFDRSRWMAVVDGLAVSLPRIPAARATSRDDRTRWPTRPRCGCAALQCQIHKARSVMERLRLHRLD
jgi:hypothetical protein